jgi:hypothetical protein
MIDNRLVQSLGEQILVLVLRPDQIVDPAYVATRMSMQGCPG